MVQGPDTSEDGFFSRWSQRKQEAQRPEEAEPRLPAPEPLPQAEPQITEEDLAALPAIEDLTAQSDIRAFMRAGVPKALRSAALRKMWLITPAIRDHVDPAVDYAWDWNTPGGVPGDGLAPSAEQSAKMLRDLFKPRQTEAADAPESADAAQADIAQADPGAVPEDKADTPQAPRDIVSEPGAQPPVARTAPTPAKTAVPTASVPPQSRPKRHGGALPG